MLGNDNHLDKTKDIEFKRIFLFFNKEFKEFKEKTQKYTKIISENNWKELRKTNI